MKTSRILLNLTLLISLSFISGFIVIEDDYPDYPNYQDYAVLDQFSNQQPLKSQAIRYDFNISMTDNSSVPLSGEVSSV